MDVRIDGEEFKEETVIDVVDEFNCPIQSDNYNRAFKNWRSDKANRYAFNYRADASEKAYVNGEGFIKEKPAYSEKKSMASLMGVIGLSLFIFLAVEIGGEYLLTLLAQTMGINAVWNINEGVVGAPEGIVSAIYIIILILKYVIPLLVLVLALKVPFAVSFPTKIRDRNMFVMSLPAIVLGFALSYYFSYYYGYSISKLGISVLNNEYYLPDNMFFLAAVLIADIILRAVLSELFIHGMIMQPLRQYGDSFALVFTSVIGALLSHDATKFCFYYMIFSIIGFFTLKTGSIKTAIVMRTMLHIMTYSSNTMFSKYDMFQYKIEMNRLMLICIIGGGIGVMLLAKLRRTSFKISSDRRFSSLRDKIITAFTDNVMILWVAATFVITLFSIRFK